MKKVLSLISAFALTIGLLSAQEGARFTVEVSSDSILMGNYFKVTFTLESAQGDEFEAPQFRDFDIISGPNYSSSLSIMNGESSQTVSYSYYLRPREVGNYYIEPASIAVGDEILETLPVEVIVVPNPDGIEQQPERQMAPQLNFGWDGFEWPDLFREFLALPQQPQEKKTKKKRKTYKL